MNDDVIEKAAEVILAHRRRGAWECGCGEYHLYIHDRARRDEVHAIHLAQALADAGLLPAKPEFDVLAYIEDVGINPIYSDQGKDAS